MTSDAAEQSSPASLWAEAKDLMHRLIDACGDPGALLAEVWLSDKERRRIAGGVLTSIVIVGFTGLLRGERESER